ncbi:MAG: multiheme c-type cytochrome [Pseudomonadota bacterium]
MRVITILFACLIATMGTAAAQAPNPLLDGKMRTGVASCATAGCHGDQVSGAGAGPVVGQNEYFKWTSSGQAGAHSRAYEALLTPWGKRIAQNLGIGPAHLADECLDCHADNTPVEMRAQRFQISDGVGCEACHGGAEDWLAFHRVGAGHEENIAAGLYPTEKPAARADLCLGCHLGSDRGDQFVSHRIMGAGHPRLKFELDLYTAIQQHHTVDDDYRARKEAPSGTEVWAVGQAAALKRILELLVDDDKGMDGVFPELVFFDCHSCHQPISRSDALLSWRPNPSRALGPGAPVLNDSNYIMLLAIMRGLDPALALELERNGMTLHQASQLGRASLVRAARAMMETTDRASALIASTDFDSNAVNAGLLRAVTDDAMARRYTNFATAEQALFAVQRLTAASGRASPEMLSAVEAAAGHAAGPYDYNATRFRRALSDIKALAL